LDEKVEEINNLNKLISETKHSHEEKIQEFEGINKQTIKKYEKHIND
jgi:hypothetical protein